MSTTHFNRSIIFSKRQGEVGIMFFSEWFKIDSDLIKGYGAVDISLVCDVPLFIDPMLIFNSENENYKKLHESIIRYFHFLYTKASQGLTPKEINAWFNFSEVPNNLSLIHIY